MSNLSESLNLGLPNNITTDLMIESALNFVLDNTTLEFDITNNVETGALPAAVKLFVLKYCEAMSTSAGVSSESIDGLSQSFNTADKSALLWEYAESLLDKWLVSPVRFIAAVDRWN